MGDGKLIVENSISHFAKLKNYASIIIQKRYVHCIYDAPIC